MGQVFVVDAVRDLPEGQGVSLREDVQDVEMQRDVLAGEAPGLERLMQRIAGDAPAVNRQEHVFSGRVLAEGHIAAKPALDPAAFVVVAAGAFCAVFLAALEAVHIKLPHVIPDALKILDKLAVSHCDRLPAVPCANSNTEQAPGKDRDRAKFDLGLSSQLFFRDFPHPPQYDDLTKAQTAAHDFACHAMNNVLCEKTRKDAGSNLLMILGLS